MSDSEKKYATFRDLRTAKPQPSTSTPSPPSTTSPARAPSTPEIAPVRNFQRVPNSSTDAMRERLYRGKSKQVWDYLWSVSRGAITPRRKVRKTRGEIKKGAGLGSMVTVDAAIEHLEAVGLIAVAPAIGSLSGNEYEVFTREEAATRLPSSTSTPSLTHNPVELVEPQSGSTSTTQTVDSQRTSGDSKTSFKTKINTDDEAAARLFEQLQAIEFEVTGKRSNDLSKWPEVLEVLKAELLIAAARTTVSNVPAFLAEHLRRRLFKDKAKLIEGAENALRGQIGPGKGISECAKCGGDGYYFDDPSDAATFNLCRHGKG